MTNSAIFDFFLNSAVLFKCNIFHILITKRIVSPTFAELISMKNEDSYGRLLTESQMTNDLKKLAKNFQLWKNRMEGIMFSMWQFD